jgi:hypothetical protein
MLTSRDSWQDKKTGRQSISCGIRFALNNDRLSPHTADAFGWFAGQEDGAPTHVFGYTVCIRGARHDGVPTVPDRGNNSGTSLMHTYIHIYIYIYIYTCMHAYVYGYEFMHA